MALPPFSERKVVGRKEEGNFCLPKKNKIPLKYKGVRIIPHDSMGYWGPSQIEMVTHILNYCKDDETKNLLAGDINTLGLNIYYIKADGEIPELCCSFYSERAELLATRLVAEGKKISTNVSFNWEKLEEMKKFFSESIVIDSKLCKFGNTGEASLRLIHPKFELDTSIQGTVSRSFLKKFCKEYSSEGGSEYINFHHHYGWESLPDLRLWPK